MRVFWVFLLISMSLLVCGQHIQSFGLFGGVSMPMTIDDGLQKDPRFRNKLTFRSIPIGLSYDYDYHNLGFVITPSYIQVGEQQVIRNINNGDVGVRNIKMDYVCLPIAFKFHLTNFSFIRLNLIAALNFSYLIKGQETLTFSASTLLYPKSVLVPTEQGYEERSDGGVAVPEVNNQEYVSHDKYLPIQIFAGLGVRSDIDLSDKWDVKLDARFNYGLLDSRKEEYKEQLKQSTGVPDLYGVRRDMYLSVEIGIARTIEIEKRYKAKKSNKPIKGEKYKRPKW